MNKVISYISIALVALLYSGSVHGQLLSPPRGNQPRNEDSIREAAIRDSLVFAGVDTSHKKKKFYSRKVTYTVGTDNATIHTIDTSVDGKQYYDPAQQADFGYRNTGNIGNAAVPLLFNPSTNMGFDLGYHQYDIYGFNRQNIKFYDSQIPYTNLFFLFGMRKEQMVSVTHNQNIGQYFNIGVNFNRFASKGGYESQETNDNSFAITTRYRSKGDHYHLMAMFYFNSYQVQENGGVMGGDIFNGASETAALAGVELTQAQSKLKQMAFHLRQEWRQGQTVERKINDSTTYSYLYPNLTFYHELETGSEQFKYNDQAPISSYYGQYGVSDDTLFNNNQYSHWGNTVGLTWGKIKDIDTSGAIYRNFLVDANMYQSVGTVTQYNQLQQIDEVRFSLRLRSHPQARSGLLYDANASYNLTGYNNQDLKLAGSLGYQLRKLGKLIATGSFTRKEAPWVYQNLYYPAFQAQNAFNKTITLSVGLQYELPQYRLKLSGQFSNITYPIYFDQNRLPQQLGGSVQAWTARLEKNFRWRHFGSDNLFVVQFFTGQDILRYPKYWSKNTLFYDNSVFKNNLVIRAGFDIYYNTNYYGYGYFGYTGQYHLQDVLNLKYYPVVDIFISMKIAEVVLFFKFENLDQGVFPQKGYYSAYKYPVPDRAFKVGLSWRFYE